MKRILVVDDIEQNRYLLEATLRGYGYEVVSAHDGAAAMAAARLQPPDLVISDILMPVMDGFALCRQWRADERLRGIPFIFYTATYTDPKDEQLALDLGADRFVLKPQEPQVMIEIVRDVLARGAKTAVPGATKGLPEEIITLREYNEALVRKLEKKLTELEVTHQQLLEDIRQRKEAEEALRQSEERWRLIYETEPECVKVISPDGRVRDMNPAGLAMIDAESLEQVRGQPLVALVVAEHREAYQEMHRQVINGQSGHLVFEVTGLKGTRRWLETREAPLRDAIGQITGALGITLDITERKQAEEALRESEEKFAKVFRNSPDAFAITSVADGRILEVNDTLCRITGLARDEILGRTSLELNFWDEPSDRDRYWKCMREHGRVKGMEITFRMKSGERRWATVSGELMELCGERVILGVLHDITERKQAETALRESEERFAAFMNHTSVLGWVKDENLRYVYFNRAFELQQGVTLASVQGRDDFALWPPDTAQALQANDRVVLQSGQPLETQEVVTDQHGQPHHSLVIKFPFRNASGRQFVGGMAIDMTEHRRTERALRASEARFRAVAESLGEGLLLTDVEDRVLYVNPRMVALTGYAVEEWVGRPAYELLLPRAQWPQLLERNRQRFAGVTERYELPLLRRDGTQFWAEIIATPVRGETGEITGTIGAITDISDRKQAEEKINQQLKELRQWYETTLGREDRVRELKREINELRARLGEAPRYPSQLDTTGAPSGPI